MHTSAPKEIKAPFDSLIKWKIKNLPNRKYQFIIGNDLLRNLDCIVDFENGNISLNGQIITLKNIPYSFN